MSELIKSVTNNYDGVSIRDFLKEELGLSSRLIRRASIEKNIFVNEQNNAHVRHHQGKAGRFFSVHRRNQSFCGRLHNGGYSGLPAFRAAYGDLF